MRSNAHVLRRAAQALALVLVLAGLYWSLARTAPAGPAPARADPNYFAFVRSMEGTRPDGELHQNASAQLVVDAELGHLFDYYLAGLGEKDLAAIKAEILRELGRRLAPPAAAQAGRLLDAYLQYKAALVGVEQAIAPGAGVAEAARQRLLAMQQLRPNYFTAAEIAGLFGASDANDLDAIARLEINSDARLSPDQRSARLAALDAGLTPAARAERDAPLKLLKLEDSVRQLRERGGDDNAVYRLRAAALTPQAAARLAEVDSEEADWSRRIARYQAERRQLGGDAAALQRLRDAGFSAEEQRRLAAYE